MKIAISMYKKVILIILTTVPFLYSNIPPATPFDGLDQALKLYGAARYNDAHDRFKYLSEFFPLDGHNTIFKFMAAKSLYKSGKLDKAQTEFNLFIREFPGSSYLSAAYLYLGHIAALNKEYQEGAVNYLKANDIDSKSKAGRIAGDNLTTMLEKDLTIDELTSLADNYPRSKMADQVMFYLAKKYYTDQKYKRSVKLFEKYLNNFSSGKHKGEAGQLLSQAKKEANKKVIIGILAPLTGSFADYGLNLVKGAKLAFDNISHIGEKEVELITIDTHGSPVHATKAVKALAREEPVAIIGPLRSESAVGAATVAGYNGIPLISPTASEQGITELGNCIYQISLSSEKIATAIAEFAVVDLGIKDFGIIAPGDFTGRQVSRAFSQKVYQLGGEVLSNTFYEPDQTDFSNQIKPLREVLLMKTEEMLADTANFVDSTEYYDFENEEWYEQEDWRVYLGGLFLPGYPSELALLVPQIRYHVISTRYLGLDGWDSQDLKEKIDRYIEGSIFATDYRPGSEGVIWDNFYLKYYTKYSEEPGRVSALAYDAANIIRLALTDGAYTADGVNAFLGSIENYQGASCVINFKTSGKANNSVSVYEIGDIKVAKLK